MYKWKKRKLFILSALIFQSLAFSNLKINVKNKVESKHVGEFHHLKIKNDTKNINKLLFNKEEEIVKITPLDLKLSFNDNLSLGINVYKTLQKRKNNQEILQPQISFKLQSPTFSKYNLYYKFIYEKDNNY